MRKSDPDLDEIAGQPKILLWKNFACCKYFLGTLF